MAEKKPEENPEEKKVKVILNVAATYAGVDYPAGLRELPEKAAKKVIEKKLGRLPEGDEADFKPLPFNETMERFSEGDDADEVFKSLRFYQPKIKAAKAAEMSVEEFLEKEAQEAAGADGTGETDKNRGKIGDTPLPEDFPGFDVLGQVEDISLEKLAEMTDGEILKIKGIGPQTLKEIREYQENQKK